MQAGLLEEHPLVERFRTLAAKEEIQVSASVALWHWVAQGVKAQLSWALVVQVVREVPARVWLEVQVVTDRTALPGDRMSDQPMAALPS